MRGAEQFIEQKFDQRLGEIKCNNGRCESCLDEEETRGCCGCVCMQCRWGDGEDVPPCPGCNFEADSTGDWRGDDLLLKRASDITPSHKSVSICRRKITPPDPSFRYPPFPNDPGTQWEGIDGGIYDSISRYYGNGSSDCSNWNIGRLTTRDRLHTGNGLFKQAPYQSKIEMTDWERCSQYTR
jgi:chitinase